MKPSEARCLCAATATWCEDQGLGLYYPARNQKVNAVEILAFRLNFHQKFRIRHISILSSCCSHHWWALFQAIDPMYEAGTPTGAIRFSFACAALGPRYGERMQKQILESSSMLKLYTCNWTHILQFNVLGTKEQDCGQASFARLWGIWTRSFQTQLWQMPRSIQIGRVGLAKLFWDDRLWSCVIIYGLSSQIVCRSQFFICVIIRSQRFKSLLACVRSSGHPCSKRSWIESWSRLYWSRENGLVVETTSFAWTL